MDKNILKNMIFMLLLLFSAACEHTKYVDKADVIKENEPNSATYNAFEISEGNIYGAEIGKPESDTPDTDLYKIWEPAGTLVTIEFESNEEDFQPYIGHTDSLSHAEFSVFTLPGKYRSEFITSMNGWQYFEIGDKRNTAEEGKKFGGFKYYFRVISSHICDMEGIENIKEDSKAEKEFSQGSPQIDISGLSLSGNGYYQIDIDTPYMLTDKFSFVMNCGSREIAAGNDDEDYYSNMMDPLIYAHLDGNLRHLLVTGKMLTDLNDTNTEEFSISLKKQPENEELEPNDTYNYANIITSGKIDGYLDKEKKNILGEYKDDEDWFRFRTEKGDILTIKITPDNSKPYTAEIWAGSYNFTGSGLIPLRASMLSGLETNTINMISPFNGEMYLDISGNDTVYHLDIIKESNLGSIGTGDVSEEFELPDCGWKFFKWQMSEENNFAEIELKAPQSSAGMSIFDSDFLPFIYLEPEETVRFFARKYDKTESLTFGIYFGECEQDSGETLTFGITESRNIPEKWDRGTDKTSKKVSAGNSYQGYFCTDEKFYENTFELDVEKNGTLYITTSPDRSTTSFNIDTVMLLIKDGEIEAESDDMIQNINFNKYSYLKYDVKKGEHYIIKTRPFMSESSNISSMNINGNYILDIQIK